MSVHLKIFLMFLKIGLTCFGGGYGMMSMIMDEGARQVGLTAAEFADMTALDLITPGTVAINAATYVGYIKGGFAGAALATMGILLPTITVSILVMTVLAHFREHRVMRGLFKGIRPACVGLLTYTAITLFSSIFFGTDTVTEIRQIAVTRDFIICAALLITAALMEFRFKIDAVITTGLGASIGLLFLR